MAQEIPKSEEFYRLIQRASRLLRRHALLIGVTLVLLAAIGWLSAAVAIDLLIPMATTFRVLFAVGFWLVLITSIAILVIWPALRRLKLEDVALRIEKTVGGMHNRLLTVLDLHRTDAAGKKQASPDMIARLLWQTRNKLAGFHIRQIVNQVPLMRSLAGLATVLLVAVLLAVVFRESAPTALARILQPMADIPPVTWLRIVAPGELAAPAGDPLTIGVDITRGEVDALMLHLQQPDGEWVIYPMQRDGERRFSYTLSGVMTDYRYKVSGGSTWTSQYGIRMVPRPVIDELARSIRLPRYMQRTELLPVADDVQRIEAPLDSHLVLAATVSGDVARGEVVMLKRSVDTHEEVQAEEHIWFEDDLPADAQTDAPWRWSTARAYTGLKSFTFGRSHQLFGFTTRLTPLHVPAAGLFYMMVWLDGSDPPGRIMLRLQQDNQTRAFEWGDKSTPAAGQPAAVHLGPLPQPTKWARLEVPADALGSNPSGMKLRGMSLEIDKGQAFFDRPGYLIRSSRPVDLVQMETIDTFPMQQDEESGLWLGDVPVTVDRLLTVRFYSSLGQASADREPMELIATKDQPPSIVVEKPAADVVLPAVQPLPISARVLDDWGVAAVGIQMGSSENALGGVRWQQADTQLGTSYSLTMAIDPVTEHLPPGQIMCYRLVAKDCKGQTSESKTFKISIATPDRVGAPETAKPPESLEPLIQKAAQLAQAPHKEREAAEFAAGLPPALRAAIDEKGQLRNQDGSPMQAEEVRKIVQQAESQLTPEQKARLAELTAELDRRQQELKNLTEMLKQAAQKSAANPLVAQQDADLLKQFAGQTQAMAADLNPPTAAEGEPARLERELKAEKLAAGQGDRLADLEQRLRQLETARQQMTSNPRLAQQMLEDQIAQAEGAAAARELEKLANDLEARSRQLQAIEHQTGLGAKQSPTADTKKLAAISQSQTKLDQAAVAAIDQFRNIVGSPAGEGKQPPAPWTPPGGQTGSTANGMDMAGADKRDAGTDKGNDKGTDKGNDKGNDKGSDKADGKGSGEATPDAGGNLWDLPAEGLAAGGSQGAASGGDQDSHLPGTGEKGAAAAGGKNGESKGPPRTPREQLTAHQAQLQQALAANAGEASALGAAVRELADRLARSSSAQETSGGKGTPQSTTAAGGENGGTGTEKSGTGNDMNGAGSDKSGAGSDKGNAGTEKSGMGNEKNGTGNEKSGAGSQTSGAGPDNGGAGNEQNNTGSQTSGTGKDQSGTGSEKSGAGSEKSGAGNDQSGTGTDKGGIGNDKSGTGSEKSGSPGPGGEQKGVTATKQLLADAATQRALEMARRMQAGLPSPQNGSQASQPGQGKLPGQPGQPGGGSSTGTVNAQPGRIATGQPPLGSDPRQRAQFYQLPPRLRGPLLEGMQERGPEGYQPMIDAYFRELSKEIK